jgi:uncharacterized coiled-coil DUF342 family protein
LLGAAQGLPLREEKQLVQQISKLNQQRGKVREYDTHKASLAELESESSKVIIVLQPSQTQTQTCRTNSKHGLALADQGHHQ